MDLTTRLRELWQALGPKQRVRIGLALAGTLALVWGFVQFSERVRYGVLYSNISRDDAAQIVAELKSRQLDYRLTANGTIVEVPVHMIDELRLELAGEGLPPGSGVGMEVFDKPAFGLSHFVQGVNYQRALEKELARTIQSLDSVTAARVHLALPEEALFVEETREPSASVVVRLRPGKVVARDRVRAIGNLVSSAVEGLSPEKVSVIDSDGRMLSGGDDPTTRLTASQHEAKRLQEQQIEQTLLSLLEPIVGAGHVRARATVELNMTRVDRVEEQYDPNGAVLRSEEKSKSSRSNGAAAGGAPGTAANLPGGGAAPGGGGDEQSQSSVTNFEINKTVSTISEPVGRLSRQSVAVVVDHVKSETTAEDGTVSMTSEPRSAEEMQKIESLVRAAIGIDPSRNDTLIVENVPFDTAPVVEPEGMDILALLPTILRYVSFPLAVLLLALFVIRPGLAALKAAAARPEPEELPAGGPMTVGQLEAQMLGGGAVAGGEALEGASPLRKKLIEAINEDPETAALVVRNWMNEQPASK